MKTSIKTNNYQDQDQDQKKSSPEQLRRDFLKKFGKYAVAVPAVTFILMSPSASADIGSGGGSGGPL